MSHNTVDTTILSSDGAVSANPALIDGINCNIGIIIDVTEQRNAENKLRDNEARYRTLLNNSLAGVLAAEVKTKQIHFVNPAICKMLGYSKSELLEKRIQDLHPADKLEHVMSEFQAQAKGEKQLALDIPFLKKDGGVIFTDVSTNSAIVDGVKCNIGVIIDITQRKNAEDEVLKMQKLRSIGTLAGGIAHDFNNVLLGIFGNMSLAKLELDDKHPAFALFGEMEKSINRATSLTNQLLTFSKGGAPLIENIRIENQVKDILLFTLSGSNVKPVIKDPEGLWSAEVDKGQIQQVLSNLIINADQAMPDGGKLYIAMENAEVSEHTVPNLNAGKYIKIVIRDEGTGIDTKHLNRIFDPYFTTKQTGNGIGLATVYSIIDKHKGYIGVASQLGKGTTFTIYVPASRTKESQDKKKKEENLLIGEKNKILIMDDEEHVRKVTERMLQHFNFSVETVEDGEQAIANYQKAMDSGSPYDVVLMDLTIPGGMGGKEAIQKVLKIDPAAKVIVFSGYSTDPIVADYSQYGFKGRLVKPFEIEGMVKEISRVMAD